MRKVIAGINLTLDGVCDHTAGIPDAELHNHYTEALNEAGVLLYGRVVYQMMEAYWPMLVQNPSGEAAMDGFAMAMDRVPKIVFSNTLQSVSWNSATLANQGLAETVKALKQEAGKPIMVGSPSLICALTNLRLIDEYQLCIHPVVAGKGMPLFHGIQERMVLKLEKTKSFASGATVMYYSPLNSNSSVQ